MMVGYAITFPGSSLTELSKNFQILFHQMLGFHLFCLANDITDIPDEKPWITLNEGDLSFHDYGKHYLSLKSEFDKTPKDSDFSNKIVEFANIHLPDFKSDSTFELLNKIMLEKPWLPFDFTKRGKNRWIYLYKHVNDETDQLMKDLEYKIPETGDFLTAHDVEFYDEDEISELHAMKEIDWDTFYDLIQEKDVIYFYKMSMDNISGKFTWIAFGMFYDGI